MPENDAILCLIRNLVPLIEDMVNAVVQVEEAHSNLENCMTSMIVAERRLISRLMAGVTATRAMSPDKNTDQLCKTVAGISADNGDDEGDKTLANITTHANGDDNDVNKN